MIPAFDMVQVTALLSEILGSRGLVYSSAQSSNLMMVSEKGHSPMFVHVDGDILRISAGSFLALNIGQDVPSSMSPVIEVIEALLDGNAEEQFGLNPSGMFGPLRWRMWYPGGERSGEILPSLSEPIARVQLPSW